MQYETFKSVGAEGGEYIQQLTGMSNMVLADGIISYGKNEIIYHFSVYKRQIKPEVMR